MEHKNFMIKTGEVCPTALGGCSLCTVIKARPWWGSYLINLSRTRRIGKSQHLPDMVVCLFNMHPAGANAVCFLTNCIFRNLVIILSPENSKYIFYRLCLVMSCQGTIFHFVVYIPLMSLILLLGCIDQVLGCSDLMVFGDGLTAEQNDTHTSTWDQSVSSLLYCHDNYRMHLYYLCEDVHSC